MRRQWAFFTVWLLPTLLGSGNAPSSATSPPATIDGPPLDQVDIVFHGLVAFVFNKDGSVTSVCLSPKGKKHLPLIAVDTASLDATNSSEPDFVTSGPGGTGFASWSFTEATFDPSNASDPSVEPNDGPLDPAQPDDGKLRWVPFMDDIFGVGQKVNATIVASAAARGRWTVGSMTSVFDAGKHETEPWDIGSRRATPLADGVRLRLKLKDSNRPLVLQLVRHTHTELIAVKGGGTVFFSVFPNKLPKRGDDEKDFHHFYMLRTSGTSGPEPKKVLSVRQVYPARCTPAIFPKYP